MTDAVGQSQPPAAHIESYASDAESILLGSLLARIHDQPAIAQASLDMYARYPEAATTLLGYLRDLPDALPVMKFIGGNDTAVPVLDVLADTFTTGADQSLGFDPDTEKAIVADSDYQLIQKERDLGKVEPEIAQIALRRHRTAFGLRRLIHYLRETPDNDLVRPA